MHYILAKDDTGALPDPEFYYVVEDDWQVFVKAIDKNCNEIGLPVAFHLVDRFAQPPTCAQQP
jgi:hypothetical protein